MSLFSSMSTAVSGLNAQSAAFTNIGNNVANSQTIGFKAVNTRFDDYFTESSQTQNGADAVVATPSYQNNVQGTVTQSTDPLAMAIAGQGFFSVTKSLGMTTAGEPVFAKTQEYTRAGDFSLNKDGYIINGAGQYLNAWPVDATTGKVNQAQLGPLQVSAANSAPVPTGTVSLSANLPATPSGTSNLVNQLSVYDALGKQHTLTLTWSQTATPGQWNVRMSSPDVTGSTVANPWTQTATVNFSTGGTAPSAGLISSITDPAGATVAYAAGQPAQFTISPDFGSGAQPINLDFGTFGKASGLTQFAGTDLAVNTINQDGLAAGAFTGITTNSSGDITATYSNGVQKVIAQVPITTFANPNGLQRQNDQSYSVTPQSGVPLTQAANANGAGRLLTQSVESSNVDIAAELSKVIVAQQAYSANAKLVTTADQMLQQTLNMKQ